MAQLKFSRQRESIKNNLMHRTDHPTADMIYDDLRKIYPNISLGTVYRNLALLSDHDEIIKINTSDGSVHYDFDTTPHDHFVCKNCGCILDIKSKESVIHPSVPSDFDGIVDECVVTFYGKCKNCCESFAVNEIK